jgi:hypothetical protein
VAQPQGTAGDDRIAGSQLDDTIRGFAGNDMLSGTSYDNHVGGSAPDYRPGVIIPELANGDRSADWLIGGEGHDTLYGAGGPDLLEGGPGSDWLVGGPGQDTLIGGEGWDLFTFGRARPGWPQLDTGQPLAADLVLDFEPGRDRLDVSGTGNPNAPGIFWLDQGAYRPDIVQTQVRWHPTADGGALVEILASTSSPAGIPEFWPRNLEYGAVKVANVSVLSQQDFRFHAGDPNPPVFQHPDPMPPPLTEAPPVYVPRPFADASEASAYRLYDTVGVQAVDEAAFPLAEEGPARQQPRRGGVVPGRGPRRRRHRGRGNAERPLDQFMPAEAECPQLPVRQKGGGAALAVVVAGEPAERLTEPLHVPGGDGAHGRPAAAGGGLRS